MTIDLGLVLTRRTNLFGIDMMTTTSSKFILETLIELTVKISSPTLSSRDFSSGDSGVILDIKTPFS